MLGDQSAAAASLCDRLAEDREALNEDRGRCMLGARSASQQKYRRWLSESFDHGGTRSLQVHPR